MVAKRGHWQLKAVTALLWRHHAWRIPKEDWQAHTVGRRADTMDLHPHRTRPIPGGGRRDQLGCTAANRELEGRALRL